MRRDSGADTRAGSGGIQTGELRDDPAADQTGKKACAKRYYPIFLDLAGKPVLMVGAGKVALRKTKGLLEAGAAVTVVAPRAEPEFTGLPLTLRLRKFRPADLNGAILTFAATDDRQVNRAVTLAARRRGIP